MKTIHLYKKLSKMNKRELYQRARELDVKNRSKMNKLELLDAIRDYLANNTGNYLVNRRQIKYAITAPQYAPEQKRLVKIDYSNGTIYQIFDQSVVSKKFDFESEFLSVYQPLKYRKQTRVTIISDRAGVRHAVDGSLVSRARFNYYRDAIKRGDFTYISDSFY